MENRHMIRASAGTGKSHFLLEKGKEYLKKGYKRNEILLCTFSKRAADDLMLRFPFGGDYIGRTYHSIYLEEVRKLKEFEGYRVMTPGDYLKFNKVTKYKILFKDGRLLYGGDGELLALYDLERHNKKTFEKEFKERTIDENDYEDFKETYENFKKNNKKIKKKTIMPDPLLDFSDMIKLYLKYCPPLNIKIALGDEVQDKTVLLWQAWEHGTKNAHQIYLSSDDKQSLYTYMGSDEKYSMRMKGRGDTLINTKLTTTRRNCPSVLKYADYFANKIKQKIDLGPTLTEKKDTNNYARYFDYFEFYYNEVMKNELKKGKKFFLLSRNNIFLHLYKGWLKDRGLSFTFYNGSSVEKYPNKKGRKKEIKEYNELLERLGEKNDIEQIEVTNIHQVKGREADFVCMLRNIQYPVLKAMIYNPDVEYRLLYTAVTRAREGFSWVTMEEAFHLVKNEYWYEMEDI